MNYYPLQYLENNELSFMAHEKNFELLRKQRFVSLLYSIVNLKGINSLILTVDEIGEEREFFPKTSINIDVNVFDSNNSELLKMLEAKICASFYHPTSHSFFMSLTYATITSINFKKQIIHYLDENFFECLEKSELEGKIKKVKVGKLSKI